MTPAQEAKAFAAKNGFHITVDGKRYALTTIAGINLAEVSSYASALRAMTAYLAGNAEWEKWQILAGKIERPMPTPKHPDGHAALTRKYVENVRCHWWVIPVGVDFNAFAGYHTRAEAIKHVRRRFNNPVHGAAYRRVGLRVEYRA